jgi:hypothetical protein
MLTSPSAHQYQRFLARARQHQHDIRIACAVLQRYRMARVAMPESYPRYPLRKWQAILRRCGNG